MSVWTAFFLVISIVILASPVLLLKPTSTGRAMHRGHIGRNGSEPDRNPVLSEKEDVDNRAEGVKNP